MHSFTEDELQLVWRCSKYPASFYRMIGYLLNYYGGTFNPDKAIVNRISVCDEDVRLKGEKDSLTEFTVLCKVFIRDTGIICDLEVNTERHSLDKITTYVFVSKNICDYIIRAGYSTPMDLFITLFKPPYGSYPTALEQRLEFIVGAYLYHRSKQDGEWIFFNNYKKAIMVHDFMIALVEEDDIIRMTSKFLIPHVHKIELNTDGPLWNRIKERCLKLIE